MKIYPNIILAFFLTIFTRLIITKEQTVLSQLASGNYGEAIMGFKSFFNKSSLIKIPKENLKRYAKDVYVDSPVYFEGNWFVRWLNWKKLDAVLSLLPKSGGRVLDFACGNGVLLPSLSEHFNWVDGIDLEIEAAIRLRNEHRLGNVRLVSTTAYVLPYEDKIFDTVFATSALEHFKDLDRAIKEIRRILKPDGYLLFLSPSENWLYRLGRWGFGYKKPEDHYWTGEEIMERLCNHFELEIKKSFPCSVLPVYIIGGFRK